MKENTTLLKKFRAELKKVADPVRAPQMQSYMKSTMPYHGVPSPVLKQVYKNVLADLTWVEEAGWKKHVRELWRHAQFREERYGAIFLTRSRHAKTFQTLSAMELYEEMIVTGAWWDYVDTLASHSVSAVLKNEPKQTKRLLLTWAKSDNIWKRRTAIICQLHAKEDTDLDFLYKCIAPSMDSEEFFLRKGIGWALRQVAWRDPNEIIRYVKENRDRLSPLSKREALKNVIKSGKIKVVP